MQSSEAVQDMLREVGQAAPHMELLALRLIKCDCELDDSPKDPGEPGNYDPKVGVSIQVPDPGRLVSTVRFEVKATTPSPLTESGEPQVPIRQFTIQGTYQVMYAIKEGADVSEKARDLFARVNAVYNAWPYWREFVQGMSARFEVPPLLIPLMRASDAANFFATVSGAEKAEGSGGG